MGARQKGKGGPALRKYLEETCPYYVYKPPQTNQWSAEEDQIFIKAHREGKTFREIAAMLPGRTKSAVAVRWTEYRYGNRHKNGTSGSAAMLAYVAVHLAASERPSSEERDATVSEDERSNYSDDDGDGEDDDSDSDEPRAAGGRQKEWTDEDDAVLVAALRAGQRVTKIKIAGRGKTAAKNRLRVAKQRGKGGPALRKYLEETCPYYVYKPPQINQWSAEEDQNFIKAHREGKTFREIAAMLPGRTK